MKVHIKFAEEKLKAHKGEVVTILEDIKTAPWNYSLNDLKTTFDAFQLRHGTAGNNQAHPLTTLAKKAENSDVIYVDDATYFTDGYGVIKGDLLNINGQPAHIKTILNKNIYESYYKLYEDEFFEESVEKLKIN